MKPLSKTRTRGGLAAWAGHFLPLTTLVSPSSYSGVSAPTSWPSPGSLPLLPRPGPTFHLLFTPSDSAQPPSEFIQGKTLALLHPSAWYTVGAP